MTLNILTMEQALQYRKLSSFAHNKFNLKSNTKDFIGPFQLCTEKNDHLDRFRYVELDIP